MLSADEVWIRLHAGGMCFHQLILVQVTRISRALISNGQGSVLFAIPTRNNVQISRIRLQLVIEYSVVENRRLNTVSDLLHILMT